MMTPKARYQQAVANGDIDQDNNQVEVIEVFERLYHQLEAHTPKKKKWLQRFQKPNIIKGLYMWGGVGVGKTFLIDLFFSCITVPKRRQHFFAFMQQTHQALQKYQGQKNPLQLIAKEVAAETKVICFDEFFVTNIADAMILGELFIHLFQAGIVLIATSNIAPGNLYQDGLQRERFIPAIKAIEKHCDVIHLSTVHDYRVSKSQPAQTYLTPITNHTQHQLERWFELLTHHQSIKTTPLIVNGHSLIIHQQSSGVLWVSFDDLCRQAFSQHDYLQLAKEFHTVIISDIPIIPAHERNTILRFIYLIDILYDGHIRLIISAETTADKIYPEGDHVFEFRRTHSRLVEMQSAAYFNRDEDIVQ